MKFSDAYRAKNDNVRVREDLIDEIRIEQVERTRAERQKNQKRQT